MLSNEEDGYRIVNWTPIWLDRGQRLMEILKQLQHPTFDEDTWIIMCAMISAHMDHDLALHRAGIEFLEDVPQDEE